MVLPCVTIAFAFLLNALLSASVEGCSQGYRNDPERKFEAYSTCAGPNFDYNYYLGAKFKVRNFSFPDAQVSLITQGSVGSLRHLPLILRRWSGPIEVAAFSYNVQDFFMIYKFFQLMDRCIAESARQLSVHFVLALPPKDEIGSTREEINACHSWAGVDLDWFVPKESDFFKDGVKVENEYLNSCTDLSELDFLQEYEEKIKNTICGKAMKKIAYPVNLLRNVGRIYATTPYHLVVDSDVVPGDTELYDMLQDLLVSENMHNLKDTALILPTFEFPEGSCSYEGGSDPVLPNSKSELLALGKDDRKLLRPFYSHVNIRVSRDINHPLWYRLSAKYDVKKNRVRSKLSLDEKIPPTNNKEQNLSFAYNIDWKSPLEPFVVFSSEAPLYDPRFVNYGVNRLSQLCELTLAGFEFVVLDQAFLIHCGLKTKENTHGEKKMESLNENLQLYTGKFFKDLLNHYPSSVDSC